MIELICVMKTSTVTVVFLLVYLLTNETSGQIDCSTESVISPPPTCPGDQLVFYCSASDTSSGPYGTTVWTVNAASATQCILNHALWPSVSRVCGSFQAQASEESPEDCFISTLNNTASLSLHGVEVACFFVLGLSDVEVGRRTISVTGPVETTGVSCGTVREGSSANTRYLTISWTTVEDFPDQTSRYVVSVIPLEQTGTEMVHEVRPGSSEFMNKQLEVEVEVGTEYQITVRTDNCGDRQEGNSVTITGFNAPHPSHVGSVRRVYRVRSGDAVLYALDFTVDIIDPTVSCAAGPIETFTISFSPRAVGSSIMLSRDNDKHCNARALRCFYTHILSSDLSVSQFDVQISASNIAGESFLASYTIVTTNRFLDGLVFNTAGPVLSSVAVTFMSGYKGEQCSFVFGEDETYTHLPLEATPTPSDEDTAVFSLPQLNALVFYYNLTCDVVQEDDFGSNLTVTLQGSFTKNCNISDLVVEVLHISTWCLEYFNGIVCVTGSEVGSVATYLCKDGYTLEGDIERICHSDGKWNASMPTCKGIPSTQDLGTTAVASITGVVSIMVSLTIGVLLGALLLHLITRAQGKPPTPSLPPVATYEDVDVSTAGRGASGHSEQSIELRSNEAYAPVEKRIVTSHNQAYGQISL